MLDVVVLMLAYIHTYLYTYSRAKRLPATDMARVYCHSYIHTYIHTCIHTTHGYFDGQASRTCTEIVYISTHRLTSGVHACTYIVTCTHRIVHMYIIPPYKHRKTQGTKRARQTTRYRCGRGKAFPRIYSFGGGTGQEVSNGDR